MVVIPHHIKILQPFLSLWNSVHSSWKSNGITSSLVQNDCMTTRYSMAASAERSAFAMLRFFRKDGARFIPAALKLFTAKVLAQMRYGTQIMCFTNLQALEL
ncbi:UNVERIFIED_CONTAM: hypothetical protein K2H54_060748, partial [Gekko kuhli]